MKKDLRLKDLCVMITFVCIADVKCMREVKELPNIKSAKKRVITSEARAKRNAAKKSALRTSIKKARIAIASDSENKEAAVKAASIKLDKAAAQGLVHKNTAARKKSRLVKAMRAAQ